jgi:hypothetical protein
MYCQDGCKTSKIVFIGTMEKKPHQTYQMSSLELVIINDIVKVCLLVIVIINDIVKVCLLVIVIGIFIVTPTKRPLIRCGWPRIISRVSHGRPRIISGQSHSASGQQRAALHQRRNEELRVDGAPVDPFETVDRLEQWAVSRERREADVECQSVPSVAAIAKIDRGQLAAMLCKLDYGRVADLVAPSKADRAKLRTAFNERHHAHVRHLFAEDKVDRGELWAVCAQQVHGGIRHSVAK